MRPVSSEPAGDASAPATAEPRAVDTFEPSGLVPSPRAMQLRADLGTRTDGLRAANDRLVRSQREQGSGPVVDALRADALRLGRELSGFISDNAQAIAAENDPVLSARVARASEVLRQSPAAMSDAETARGLSNAAAVFEVAADSGGLRAVAGLSGVLGGVASAITSGQNFVNGQGNIYDAGAIAATGVGALASVRGATALGLGATAVELALSGIADSVRSGTDRTATEQALERSGVPRETARALANANPAILRALTDRGVSNERILEYARVAPTVLRSGNPAIIRELGGWQNLTAPRLQQLQRWEQLLR